MWRTKSEEADKWVDWLPNPCRLSGLQRFTPGNKTTSGIKHYTPSYPPKYTHQIHSRQFGGRQGVSTAHATQTFLNDMDSDAPWEGIFAFDIYHAFDSPPKIVIREVLD